MKHKSITLYGIKPKDMPEGFRIGLQMQLDGAKKQLRELMQYGFMERNEELVISINQAITWNEAKLEELE